MRAKMVDPMWNEDEKTQEPAVVSSKREIAASVQNISKSFGETSILNNVTFDVAKGESLVLLGASGSGKTTILRIIAGLEQPDSGKVFLQGDDVTDLPARERNVGVIFQDYALFPLMTVEQNIAYGLRLRNRSGKEIKETVERLLTLVRLEEHRGKYPSQLSGGQRQRVAIARTLAYEPRVLLFDEPFGALDVHTRVRLRREILALLREVKVPAIFITHDQEEALDLGDRIAVLNAGQLEQVGTPDEVYNRPETEFVATFLGAANLLLGVVGNNTVEIGTVAVVIPAQESARFRRGQAVKLIFRPEDVCLSRTGAIPEDCERLANGIVDEINFVGAYERLVIRLDLIERQTAEGKPPLYDVSLSTRDKRTGIPIVMTRTKAEANAQPLAVGDRVATGLRTFRILPNYALSSQRSSRIED